MQPSDSSLSNIENKSVPARPKIVTIYLVLSLIVTALVTLVIFIITTPAAGLHLTPAESVPYYLIALVNLGCLVSTIALFFWRKWAAIVFYILLGLSLLWFGYTFLVQEGLSTFTVSGFLALGVVPIFIFRWVVGKIWSRLI
jgi:hypothetical protein